MTSREKRPPSFQQIYGHFLLNGRERSHSNVQKSEGSLVDCPKEEAPQRIWSYLESFRPSDANSNLLSLREGVLPTLYSKARKYSVFTHKRNKNRSFREESPMKIKNSHQLFPNLKTSPLRLKT